MLAKQSKNKEKEQKGGFLGILLDTLAVNAIGNILAVKAKIQGGGVIRVGEGTTREGQDFLMPPHRLTKFVMQKYYQNEPKF